MGNADTLTRIEPEYVFKVEHGNDRRTRLVSVHAGTKRAARLKAIDQTVGPARESHGPDASAANVLHRLAWRPS